jgi:hypothetical protein
MEIPRIKLVSEDVSIWLVYAGIRRRHLDEFRRSKTVFLETPGFNANKNTFSDFDEVRQRLAMSDAIRRWQLQKNGPRPSRRFANYQPPGPQSADFKSFLAEAANIDRLFNEVKVGDLVLSPPLGHFNPFLIGEITKEWEPDDAIGIPFFEDELVPVRRVRWLANHLSRRDFSNNLAKRLINRHAISEVDPAFTEEILRKVYPSFIWGDESKIDLFGTKYSGDDPIEILESAKLLKYAVAAAFAHDNGHFEEFQSLAYDEAIRKFYDVNLVEQFGMTFNSPGKFLAVIKSATASPKIAACLTILTSPENQAVKDAVTSVASQFKKSLVGTSKAQRDNLDHFLGSIRLDTFEKVKMEHGLPADATLGLTLDRSEYEKSILAVQDELDDRN